jgi:integrating conjugative element protein (TIGR03765 family)
MTPGKVEHRPLIKINANMPRAAMRPLFLFGADERSLTWVRENRQRFKELRAVGMLIEARTDREVTAAQQALGDIPMFGGSANEIARALKLHHYPVLITPEGVSQ